MYRGKFKNRFKGRGDRNRFTRTPEFRRNEIPSRFLAREDEQHTKYGPAEILDRQGNGFASRNYEFGQNSGFGTPVNVSSNSLGSDPQKQLFPSPMTPGSTQNPFSFGSMVENPRNGGITGDQIAGLPNFQFLVTPGQYSSNPNPFSATGMSSMQNFQLPVNGSGYSGASGIPQLTNFQNSLNSASGTMHTTYTSEMNKQINNFRQLEFHLTSR